MIPQSTMRQSFDGRPLLERYKRRVGALRTDRSSFISHWQELSTFIQPLLGRFLTSDVNKGGKRHQSIINSHAGWALRVAVAGLIAGAMSPARPFFKLDPADAGLREFQPVKEWLEGAEKLLQLILKKSNFYSMAAPLLEELLTFGTGAMYQEDDFQDVARFYTLPIGSYMIAQDERQNVSVLIREYMCTVEQIVGKFGLENTSTTVRNLWTTGNYDSLVQVTHYLGPNQDFDPASRGGRKAKPWSSDYYETAAPYGETKFLGRFGFAEFPAYIPRWAVTGEDVYGTNCPGMMSLGDIKSLQILEKRKAQGIDKLVNPPLVGPGQLRNTPVNALPGGLTTYDGDPQRTELKALYQLQIPVNEIRAEIAAMERRVDDNFFVELFLAISNMEGIQPRNEYDLVQRNQERLLQLGPVLQQIHGEFLSRVIDRTFARVVSAGLLPPPPPELSGQELEIEYISPLAMAQRAAALEPIERYSLFVSSLSEKYPSALDKFDPDQAADEYAFALGVPARVVVPDDKVKQIREDRAQQQQAQQAMAMAAQAADVAKTASEAKTGDASVLTNLGGATANA